MTVLVDSDILIEVSRGKDQDIISQWRDLSNSDAAILYSAISAAELWAGARPNEHIALDKLFRTLSCVSVTAEVGRQAGIYLGHFRKSHGVELADALIAASAVVSNADLWTRNKEHYSVKDLSFFD